jgi:formylglycine-generating enzyme required for sulfatase activity
MNTRPRIARSLSGTVVLLTAAALAPQTKLAADTFGSGANQFTVDFVTTGDPGNAPDNTTYGAVPYSYRMGKYEVSRDVITKANSAGGLGISMADMSSYGGNGMNRPATGVSWYEAARFVNWLNTSTGHTQAYNFVGDVFVLWSPADAWQLGGENLFRNKGAFYFLPSENEWYKAAYYDGVAAVYYDYPTGSDSPPAAVAGGTSPGTAVYSQPWDQGPTDIVNAGGLSFSGTMAQGGNVWDLLESAFDGVNDSSLVLEDRVWRGGFWGFSEFYLASSTRNPLLPSVEDGFIGFRVAAVPEPLGSAGVIGVAALGFALWRRRGSR